MDFLLEETMLAAIYNKVKNGRELCDYQCGEKFARDMYLKEKMNVCKANCDVIWDGNYIRQLQEMEKNTVTPLTMEQRFDIRKRLVAARQKLIGSKTRLYKTKISLKRAMYQQPSTQPYVNMSTKES